MNSQLKYRVEITDIKKVQELKEKCSDDFTVRLLATDVELFFTLESVWHFVGKRLKKVSPNMWFGKDTEFNLEYTVTRI